jgi:hypothetical protein
LYNYRRRVNDEKFQPNNYIKETSKNKRGDKLEKADNTENLYTVRKLPSIYVFVHSLETIVGKLRLKNNTPLKKCHWLIVVAYLSIEQYDRKFVLK